MGKIKLTILRKQDRPRTEPKPPSMRRIKRADRRSDRRAGTFAQVMPDIVILKLKKRHFFNELVTHEHYSDERQDKTSERRVKRHVCNADDSDRVAWFELLVEQGYGKIVRKPGKTIWHKVEKQNNSYKPTKPHYKGNTGRR